MKIRELDDDRVVDVYAIYWVNGVRHHLVIPYKEFGGLTAVIESKCEVIDFSVDDYILRKSGGNGDILIHWATDKDDLLDDLINHDEDAMKELERRLREETPPYLKKQA